jgi:hypothetical protein
MDQEANDKRFTPIEKRAVSGWAEAVPPAKTTASSKSESVDAISAIYREGEAAPQQQFLRDQSEEEEMIPSEPRRTSEGRRLAKAEGNGVMDSLLKGLNAIVSLALMDSEKYQQVGRSMGDGAHTLDPEYKPCVLRLQEQIENAEERLERQYPDHAAALSSLSSHVHRLQSNQLNLRAELDQQTEELRCHRETIASKEKENRKLRESLQQANTSNKKLGKKLLKMYREKKMLEDRVKLYEQQMGQLKEKQRELEETNTVHRLRAHELILSTRNRSRTESNISLSLSDIESGSLDYANPFPDGAKGEGHQEDPSIESTVENDSFSSLLTTTSEPVLRLEPGSTESLYYPGQTLLSENPESCLTDPCSSQPYEYTLWFREGAETGLKIRSIAIEKEAPKPEGLLDAIFQCDDDTSERDAGARNSSYSFSLRPNFLSRMGRQQETTAQGGVKSSLQATEATPRHIFLVSGLTSDFDKDTHDTEPKPGVRVIAVKGETVEETWTLEELLKRMDCHRDSDITQAGEHGCDQSNAFAVTFRNEPRTLKELTEGLTREPDHSLSLEDSSNNEATASLTKKPPSPPPDQIPVDETLPVPENSEHSAFDFNMFTMMRHRGSVTKEQHTQDSVGIQSTNQDSTHTVKSSSSGASMSSMLNNATRSFRNLTVPTWSRNGQSEVGRTDSEQGLNEIRESRWSS